MKKNVRFFKKSIKFRKANHLTEKSPLIIQEFMRDIQHVFGIESKTLAKFFKEMYESQNRKYNIHEINFETIFLDGVYSMCTLLSCSLAY